MKYVRTLYGVYALKKKLKHDIDVYRFLDGKVIGSQRYYDVTIVAEADDIEKLCDEAVFFDKDNKPHYKSQENNLWYLGASLFAETVRLGIFTDKGLIYVAKLNDKGELELL